MNQQRLQALLARVKTANDEKEGLLARARAYARRNPAAAGAAGAGGTAALLAALFSRRGNRLRNALLAGGLGAGAGYGAGRWYREHWERMNEEDRQRAEQAAIDAWERMNEKDRQRAEQAAIDARVDAEIVARQKPAPPTGAGLPPRLTGVQEPNPFTQYVPLIFDYHPTPPAVQEPNPFTQYAPPAITGKRRTGGRSRDELERQMEEIRSRTDTQGLITTGRDALNHLLRRPLGPKYRSPNKGTAR